MNNSFSKILHQEAEPLWQASIHHPFIEGLASGDLPVDIFRYYLIQDSKYLEAFGQMHEKAAAILPQEQGDLLLELAAEAGEDIKRSPMLKKVDLTADQIDQAPIAPTNYAYITHMEHQLQVSPAAAVAGLLPCYWLYDEIAAYWQGQKSPVSVYQDFFDSYTSAEFDSSTQKLIGLVDELATSSAAQEQMMRAFLRSSSYELSFWQMACQKESWYDLV